MLCYDIGLAFGFIFIDLYEISITYELNCREIVEKYFVSQKNDDKQTFKINLDILLNKIPKIKISNINSDLINKVALFGSSDVFGKEQDNKTIPNSDIFRLQLVLKDIKIYSTVQKSHVIGIYNSDYMKNETLEELETFYNVILIKYINEITLDIYNDIKNNAPYFDCLGKDCGRNKSCMLYFFDENEQAAANLCPPPPNNCAIFPISVD